MKLLITLFVFIACVCKAQIKIGVWRGILVINTEKNIELPFNFDIKLSNEKYQLVIHNAQEQIVVDEVFYKKDSLNFKMPIFDTEFKTKIIGDTMLSGIWVNHTKKEKNTITFLASFGNKKRFNVVETKSNLFYNGKWEVSFSEGTADSSKAIGVFKHAANSNKVEGTFLTETGDYRFLEGVIDNNKLFLSCFDGSHAFLFIAENNGSEIVKGDFYSGTSWHENWTARRNEKFELKNPESLTYLKNANEKISFAFYNSKNKKISLNDEAYKNKVVIIQIMGTWCPNCMDESAYLSKVYKQYHKNGLEVIALAYERTIDKEQAIKNIERLAKRFNIEYEILLTGASGKEKASESLPFLNKVMAFPTTIFLDKDHHVKSIYTGFNGPATGKAYESYMFKTENLINKLLQNKN